MHEFDDIYDDDRFDEDGRVIRPNKSQLHREAIALLELGKKLAAQDESTLQKIEMPPELYEALMQAKSIHQRGAQKRHFKYIGKLLRNINVDELEETIEIIEQNIQQANQEFHMIERWRDRLLNDDDGQALTEFLDDYPGADSGQIRQLIRNARKEFLQNKPHKSSRQLFKVLRATVEGSE